MANLPADLPENWTQGQIISPNGTEVGLTEQHGYNYLMQQVNAAQTAINNIVAGISGVAQETSVQEIITNIGNTNDTGATDNSGTVMGKLNTLISQNGIKKIYRGSATLDNNSSVTVPLDNVNPEKTTAYVSVMGYREARGGGSIAAKPSITVSDTKFVFANNGGASSSSGSLHPYPSQIIYEVIEYY